MSSKTIYAIEISLSIKRDLKSKIRLLRKQLRTRVSSKKQCIQGLSHMSQDTDGKRHFKIPTLINGSTIMIKDDKLPWSHRENIIIKNSTGTRSTNSTSIVQHKVFMLGDAHLRGSVVQLRSELSAKF
jgi:hypothetical protein